MLAENLVGRGFSSKLRRKSFQSQGLGLAVSHKKVLVLSAVAAASLLCQQFAKAQALQTDTLSWSVGSSTWDNTTANWSDVTNPLATPPILYSEASGPPGNPVQFPGSNTNASNIITVNPVTNSGVSPASVEFTAGTASYQFNDGTGATNGIQGNINLTLDSGYTGTVYLDGQDSITGTATANSGTLQLTGSAGSTLGTGSIVLAGGSVAFQHGLSAFANNITVNQGTSGFVTNSSGDNVVLVGNISSGVGATISNTILNDTGAATNSIAPLTGANPMAAFTGTLNIDPTSAGDLRLQTIATGDTIGSPTALFNLGTGTAELEMENVTGVVLLGGLEGGVNTTSGGGSHSGSNNNNEAEFVVGGDGLNTVFNGIMNQGSERSILEVTGAGSLTLSNGSNSYAAKSAVSTQILGNGQEPYFAASTSAFLTANASTGGGALYVSNTTGSGTSTGPVFVEGASSTTGTLPAGAKTYGGLLGGDGIISGEVSTIVNTINAATNSASPLATYLAGPHIAPGAAGSNTSNTLSLTGGLQLGDWTNLDMSLDTAPNTPADDMIASTATAANSLLLSFDGNIQVNFAFPNGAPATGVPYPLITYVAGSDAYTSGGAGTSASLANWVATNVPAGDTAAFSDSGSAIDVTFTAAAVPEPASASLLALSAVGLLARRRRSTTQA
jgi:hypothetical protein